MSNNQPTAGLHHTLAIQRAGGDIRECKKPPKVASVLIQMRKSEVNAGVSCTPTAPSLHAAILLPKLQLLATHTSLRPEETPTPELAYSRAAIAALK